MSLLTVLNVTSAASTAWLDIDGCKMYTLQQTGLSGAEDITVHIENSTTDEPLQVNGDLIKLTVSHKMMRLIGPMRVKLVKTVTAVAPRVELFEKSCNSSHLFIGG
jgi:hypothetical protein